MNCGTSRSTHKKRRSQETKIEQENLMHFIAKCCTVVHVSDVAPEENRVCSLAGKTFSLFWVVISSQKFKKA